MATQPHRPDGKTFWAAVITVAAVYVYFLIFAQFGFLKAARAVLGGCKIEALHPLLAVMGIAGIAGSVLAARGFRPVRGQRWFGAGLGLGALAAGWTLRAEAWGEFHGIAFLTGTGTGLATVTLAGMLGHAVGREQLGWVIGLGTGLAYGFCNLPGIFNAGAKTQACVALAAALVGCMAGGRLTRERSVEVPVDGDYSRAGIATWVGVFLVLIGFDSLFFGLLQHSPEWSERMWGTPARQLGNAIVHLGAAILAGWALGRVGLAGVVSIAAAALLLGAAGIQVSGAGWIYIAAVSAYSTALVYYPACSGRPGLAAVLYAVAGWGGSAAGLMLAGETMEWPILLPVLCAGLIAGALAWRRRPGGR